MHALCDRALFFLHIPKTAGTSLRELLSPRFSPAEILAFERDDSPELRRERLAGLDRYRFVHGHVPYALAGRFERRPFVATILRDPLERAVSAFHFMQRQVLGPVSSARARDYAAATRMSIGELIRHEPLAASRHLGNLQSWLLSTPKIEERFEYRDEYRDAVSDSDLERAKEHLAACDFIGLTERMTESVELLAYALQARPFGKVSTANRSPARPAAAALDPSTMAALADLTAQDRELYIFACRLFEERRRAMMLNADHPGLEAVHPSPAPVFTFDRAIPGDGWYAPERDGERWFSWTGPACDSTLELASPPGRDLVLEARRAARHGVGVPVEPGGAPQRCTPSPSDAAKCSGASPHGRRAPRSRARFGRRQLDRYSRAGSAPPVRAGPGSRRQPAAGDRHP